MSANLKDVVPIKIDRFTQIYRQPTIKIFATKPHPPRLRSRTTLYRELDQNALWRRQGEAEGSPLIQSGAFRPNAAAHRLNQFLGDG
jgi:hypothetical protein